MSPQTDEPSEDEPGDPFFGEEGGVRHYILQKGSMVFEVLAEIPNMFDVIRALKDMPESDLKAIVLERLYMWHLAKNDGLPPREWLKLPDSDA